MFEMVWFVMTITRTGPSQIGIEETTKFKTEVACEQFGASMKLRMEDWMRGAMHPVVAHHLCRPSGQPT